LESAAFGFTSEPNPEPIMHELSIAQEIISIVHQYVPSPQPHSVKNVKMRIGKMINILPDSLQFCFEALVTGGPLEGAKLEIDVVPLSLCCSECAAVSTMDGYTFMCPKCGSARMQTISGNELNVVEIEMNDKLQETP
jgi:hydrogenase nickel incorporation protein HypA/HybF